MKTLPVFSPALKIYFPLSNVMTTVGSVSEVSLLTTDADQSIPLEYRRTNDDLKSLE